MAVYAVKPEDYKQAEDPAEWIKYFRIESFVDSVQFGFEIFHNPPNNNTSNLVSIYACFFYLFLRGSLPVLKKVCKNRSS